MGVETTIEKQKRGKLTNTDSYPLGVDTQGTIGIVTNPERRAFRQEPGASPESTPYRHAQYREDVGRRFQSVESTPRSGVTKVKDNPEIDDEGRVKSPSQLGGNEWRGYPRPVSQDTSSIAIVRDEDARATQKEPGYVGFQRQSLQNRFSSIESIPGYKDNPSTSSPTRPTTPNPEISVTPATQPPRKADLRDLEGPAVGPTSPGPNVANIYHEAEHDAEEREKEDKAELQGTSTTGIGPNPAFRRKQGNPVEDRGENE